MKVRDYMWIAACVAILPTFGLANCPNPEGGPIDKAPSIENGVVTYRTGLQVDIDGAANAYGVDGGFSARPGGALDHICSGANVLTLSRGKTLTNKYPDFSVAGSSQHCLADYQRLRDAGFPPCTSGECMEFYGVHSSARPCSAQNVSGAGNCGIPVRQKDASGQPQPYYVSTTSWSKPGAREDEQEGFPDARYVPYLVYDRDKLHPLGLALGDLGLIAWKGRSTFFVYGDSGDHLCEGSLATHNRLHGKADAEWVNWQALGVPSGALVIAFPGSGRYLTEFPALKTQGPSPAHLVYEAGLKALDAAGGDKLLPLVGLSSRDTIAKE